VRKSRRNDARRERARKRSAGGDTPKLNGGKAGGASRSAKPTSKFIILRCYAPGRPFVASGSTPNEEEDDSRVCACREQIAGAYVVRWRERQMLVVDSDARQKDYEPCTIKVE